MKLKPLAALAVALVIVLALFVGIRAFLHRPNAWQAAVLQTVSLRIQTDGVDGRLSDELATLTSDRPIYVAKVAGSDEAEFQIVAASQRGAVGVTLDTYWDQSSRWYASAGPIKGPAGDSYMVYAAR